MCRLTVFWGKDAKNFNYLLTEAENCLLKQSKRDISNRPNPDGWGVVYRNDQQIDAVKNIKPAYLDENFIPSTSNLKGDLMFAHVRRRSQGPVLMENTHPFVYEQWMFMHNGNIPNFEHCKKLLNRNLSSDEAIETEGTTDSEFLFKYFLQWFRKSKNCDEYCALNIIHHIISQIFKLIEPDNEKKLALNFMLTDGNYIIGFRKNRTLYYSLDDNSIVISSEPLDSKAEWNEIPEEHFILSTKPGEIKLAAFDITSNRKHIDFITSESTQ